MGKTKRRVALYLRVSTDQQTTQNQRRELEAVCAQRGWDIAQVFEDAGFSGSKGRDKRPAFDAMMKAAARGKIDLVMVWAVDRLGRSTATVAPALAELAEMNVAFYAHKEGMDATTAHGRAMLQMAAVFAELERSMIVDRVRSGLERAKAQGKTLGRPKVPAATEEAIRERLAAGTGMLKIATDLGIGTSTVQRIRREMSAAP